MFMYSGTIVLEVNKKNHVLKKMCVRTEYGKMFVYHNIGGLQ